MPSLLGRNGISTSIIFLSIWISPNDDTQFLNEPSDSIDLLEEVLNGLVGNHLLVEDVSTRLGALHHTNNLRVCATIL